MSNARENTEQEYENFRAYHSLQYDRMDKIESRREVFSSLVLTASLGVVTFAFSKDSQINIIVGFTLAITMVLANCIAIQFAERSYKLFKMHQKRAEEARNVYAPKLNEINALVDKPDGESDWLSRPKLYKYLHGITICVIVLALFSPYILPKEHKPDRKIEIKATTAVTANKPVNTTVVSLTIAR